jgi:hypothetical protein
MLLAGTRAAAASMAAFGVAAAAISCVAHSRGESCRDLVARAVDSVQPRCVSVCGMCSHRDHSSVDCALLGLRL